MRTLYEFYRNLKSMLWKRYRCLTRTDAADRQNTVDPAVAPIRAASVPGRGEDRDTDVALAPTPTTRGCIGREGLPRTSPSSVPAPSTHPTAFKQSVRSSPASTTGDGSRDQYTRGPCRRVNGRLGVLPRTCVGMRSVRQFEFVASEDCVSPGTRSPRSIASQRPRIGLDRPAASAGGAVLMWKRRRGDLRQRPALRNYVVRSLFIQVSWR